MDNNIINDDIIEKVVIKSVAIYKAMSVLPAPPFEDKFKKETLCQKNENIQKQSLEKCLKETEPNKENEIIDTTNDIKKSLEKKSWKDITNPKERKKAYHKVYYEVNKQTLNDKQKAYNKVNKDKIKAYNKVNEDKIKAYKKDYYQDNKDKIKEYLDANKDKIRVKKNNYFKNRLKTNIQYKLSHNLRNRLNIAINRNQKIGSAVDDLGCSIPELKVYLESKFQPGMTWDNWSDVGWHIDHIKPLASFDLTDRKQFLEACHYTNLQPLWAKDNLIKSDKLI